MQVGMDTEAAGAGGASVFDLPKLDPKVLNERAMVWLPDPDSIRLQYVHALGGKKAQLPGHPEPAWGGNWLCDGRNEVLKASSNGLDPEACFMCREHAAGNNLVGKSQRKFIVQVVRYNTDPNGSLLNPFGATLLVWQFSDKQYRLLQDIVSTWGSLRDRDLMLTCDNLGFKSWTVQPTPEVLFMRDQGWIQLITQVVQTQAVPGEDLERILGRRATNQQEIQAKLAEITPASMAPAVAYQAPAIPGMPPGMAPAPGVMPPPMAPAGPPAMVPPPAVGYAQAPPSEALYPPGGPFDQPQQAMAVMPPAPAMVPPAMPPTPPPTAQAGPPLPGVPDLPQAPAPAMPQAPAPAMPQVPDLTQPPPAPAPAPAPAMPTAPPPMVPPQAVPAAPAQPGVPTDLGALMQAPPPPAPPA